MKISLFVEIGTDKLFFFFFWKASYLTIIARQRWLIWTGCWRDGLLSSYECVYACVTKKNIYKSIQLCLVVDNWRFDTVRNGASQREASLSYLELHFPWVASIPSILCSRHAHSLSLAETRRSQLAAENRNQHFTMLGQAIRRFTTSAVRSSHYSEGPGKVK